MNAHYAPDLPEAATRSMAKLTTVTLTGADERTDIGHLAQFAADHPYLEIGLLYTATPENRNRYPSLEWLHKASAALAGACAIHVCGRGARQQLRDGGLTGLVSNALRVQVNGVVHPADWFDLSLCDRVLQEVTRTFRTLRPHP